MTSHLLLGHSLQESRQPVGYDANESDFLGKVRMLALGEKDKDMVGC